MNAYAKIRAALVLCDCETCTEALAALAELERSAREPIGFQIRLKGREKWVESFTTYRAPDSFELRECYIRNVYAAPPIPAGLVELREPSDDECLDIWRQSKENEGDGSKVCAGRAMFHAVSKWLKGEL